MFSIAFLVSALLDFSIWLLFGETTSAPPEGLALVGFASIFFASAYSFWGFGMERGNPKLLSVASFLTPALSSVHLSVLGQIQFNARLLIALLCILSAIGIAKCAEGKD